MENENKNFNSVIKTFSGMCWEVNISSVSRYIRVHYEDLTLYPVHSMKKFMQFLGIEFTIRIHRAITSHTKDLNKEDNEHMFKVSKNSVTKPFKWRQLRDFAFADEVQMHCSDVIQEMNLRLFRTLEEYSNSSLSVQLHSTMELTSS